MARGATMYRLSLTVSDVDRNVYETLDLRLARHPSESMRYLVTRALAFALSYEEHLAMGRGLSTAEDPAISLHDLTGLLLVWIDIGAPSAERLHRASKAARKVMVYTGDDPRALLRELGQRTIHRADELEMFAITPALVDALGDMLERTTEWEVTRTGGDLFVNAGGQSLQGTIERVVVPDLV